MKKLHDFANALNNSNALWLDAINGWESSYAS